MNERIKELAEQAEDDVIADHRGDEFHKAYTQRLAELIVAECQEVVRWAISVDSTIDRVPVLIKEHFGVEE